MEEDQVKKLFKEQSRRLDNLRNESDGLSSIGKVFLRNNGQHDAELDAMKLKHAEIMGKIQSNIKQEHLNHSIQEVLFKVCNDVLDAIWDKGKSEMMSVYKHEVDIHAKQTAINQIQTESLNLSKKIIKIGVNMRLNAKTAHEGVAKVALFSASKAISKSLSSINFMRNELTTADFLQMDSRDSERRETALEVDTLLAELHRIILPMREDVELKISATSQIVQRLEIDDESLNQMNSIAEKTRSKIYHIPLATNEHESFSDVVMKTMKNIHELKLEVTTEKLEKQLREGEGLVRTEEREEEVSSSTIKYKPRN